MKRSLYRWLGWGVCLVVPVAAARLALVWNQLPSRLATHFDLAGHPNGWMSPTAFLTFVLITLAASAATSIVMVTRISQPDLSAWALLGFLYVVSGILYGAVEGVVRYNLYAAPVNPLPFLIAGFGSLLAVIAVYLGTRRGPHLPSPNVIAEEAHSSHLWAAVIFLPCALLVALIISAPNLIVRLALALTTLVLLMAGIMAWSGFRYVFSRSGLEIRTLGFRLRTVPIGQIRDYAADSWSPTGGYGIRGVGNTRAYVWGKRGVRIHTWDGELFLGHPDPERLLRDLNAMMSFAHPGGDVKTL